MLLIKGISESRVNFLLIISSSLYSDVKLEFKISFSEIIAELKNCCLKDIHFKGSLISTSSILVEVADV